MRHVSQGTSKQTEENAGMLNQSMLLTVGLVVGLGVGE